MTIQFTLTGTDNMVRRIQKVSLAFPDYIDDALILEANAIMKESKEKWAPEDGGDLIASGEVIVGAKGTLIGEGISFSGLAHNIVLSYGGDPTNPAHDYALAVHEHPSYHSPFTWKGVTISWTKPGTGPKYLERPLKRARRGIMGRMAASMRLQLNANPAVQGT